MRLGNVLARHKLVILASSASVAFHLLWISIVRIDYGNDRDRSSRASFARVSFVGPVFTRPVINIDLTPPRGNMLDERYSGSAGSKISGTISDNKGRAVRDGLYGRSAAQSPVMLKMAVDALSNEKEIPKSEAD